MKKIGLLLLATASLTLSAGNFDLTIDPPAGLTPEETPMFVCLGWDDNAYEDAMTWINDFTRPLRNKDGSAVRNTFFVTSGFADGQKTANGQTASAVLETWRTSFADGHEIANHTELHEKGKATADEAYWTEAIANCTKFLQDSIVGKGVKIEGFRTPFLGYSAPTFQAIKAAGFRYDCSVEVGYDWYSIKPGYNGPDGWVSGVNFETGKAKGGKVHWWPYDLVNGASTGSQAIPGSVLPGPNDNLGGLLEVQVSRYQYPSNTILTDDELLNIDDAMAVTGVTGFDFNFFKSLSAQQKNKEKILHMLKFNFQQRMQGNRCPFTVNLHTDIYSEFKADVNEPTSQDYIHDSFEERRWIIEEFLKYVIQFEDVRVVPYTTMLDWMENPVHTQDYVAPKAGDVAINTEVQKASNRGLAMTTQNNSLQVSIPAAGHYSLKVTSLNGRVLGELHSGNLSAGNQSFSLSGLNAATGVYLVQVEGAVNGVARVMLK